MTRLKNKFLLILASIVGLCLSFCVVLFRPSTTVKANADTVADVTNTGENYYYYFDKDFCLFDYFTVADEGKVVVFYAMYLGDPVFTSSAVVTFNTSITNSNYLVLERRDFSSTGDMDTFVYRPYYMKTSPSSVDRLDLYIFDDSSNPTFIRLDTVIVSGMKSTSFNPYSQGYNAGSEAGFEDGRVYGYEKGYITGYSDGYHTAESKFYDLGYEEGFDLGWYQGDTSGYARGLLESNRGMWSTWFDFSFGSPTNNVTVEVRSDNYDVYQNGGISFNKLKTLFYEECELQGVTPGNIDTNPVTVTISISPTNTNFSVLSTGGRLFDGYYTADDVRFWGTWSIPDVAEQSDYYEFMTYNTLSVVPSAFTFTFDSTWDFNVYLWDELVGMADYNLGYDQGYIGGYHEGFDEGKKVADQDLDNAYNNGYAVGLAKAEKFDFAFAVSTVVGAPVQVVKEFLSFELLGVNMLAFFSGIFSLLIIVKVIKFFI